MNLYNLQLWSTTNTPRRVQLLITTILLFFISESFGQILTLTPSLSLSERYDDNIFQFPSDDEEEDFITIITPGIQLRYQPASSTLLDLDYHTDFEFFAQNSEQNQIGHRGRLRFEAPITPFISIAVRDTLIITEEPGDRTLDIDEETGLRSISEESRQKTIRNSATANLEVLLTARSRLGFLFESLLDDVEDPDEVDEFRNRIGVELGYITNVRRENRVRLFYDVTFHTFSENGPLQVGESEEPDFQVHTINVGYSHAFSPTLSGDVAVGYAITNSDSSTEDEHAGLVTELGLVKTLKNGSVSFRYKRDFTSGGGDGGEVLADIFTLVVSSGLTPKIVASLGSNLSYFNFQEEGDDDRMFWVVRPNLTYQILRFWRLSIAYDFSITNYKTSSRADRVDHFLTFASQFTIRESLFLGMTYRYRTRQFGEGAIESNDNEFDRNEVMLTLTYAPTLLFGR